MAKFNTKSISNRGTFCNFSLAPKRKIYKTSMRHLKIHKFPFKNVIVLAIECKMYLKIQQKLQCLGWEIRREENKVEFLEGGFLDAKLPFFHKKKAEHSFQLSLSILLSFNGVFLSLKCRTLVFKHLHGDRAAHSHCVENGYRSLRFPNMVKLNIHEHWARVTRFNP